MVVFSFATVVLFLLTNSVQDPLLQLVYLSFPIYGSFSIFLCLSWSWHFCRALVTYFVDWPSSCACWCFLWRQMISVKNSTEVICPQHITTRDETCNFKNINYSHFSSVFCKAEWKKNVLETQKFLAKPYVNM